MVLAPPVKEIKRPQRNMRVLFGAVIALVLAAVIVGIVIGKALTGSGTRTAAPAGQTGSVTLSTGYLAAGLHGDVYSTSLQGNRIVRLVGGREVARAQVLRPLGIAVGAGGAVYVAESRNCRIDTYTPDLHLESSVVACGARSAGYDGPAVLAVGPLGRIYATSQATSNVHVFSPSGRMLQSFNTGGSRMRYAGMAVSPTGTIYVTDASMDRVISLPVGSNRSSIWGGYGTAPGRFQRPTQIGIDGAGNIYVLDAGNARVQKLSAACKPILSWGRNGSVSVANPVGMTVNSRGVVFVTTANGSVERISPAGRAATTWK